MTTPPLDAARALFDTLDAAAAATAAGDPMPQSSLDAIEAAGLYGPMVPSAAGGLELPLPEIVDVYAEISRADGSAGWCYFAADVATAFMGAYLPDAGADEVFADGLPVVAGQLLPNGVATPAGDDFVLNGDFQFGSGIAHAAWASAGMMTAPDDGTDPAFLVGCVPIDQAELQGNWDVLGLQATASWDYTIRDAPLPRHRTFDFFAPTIHRGGPMYALGIVALTAAGHAGWALGVTRRVLDEVAALAATTTRMGAASSLADSERFLFEFGVLEGRFRAGEAWVRQACADAEAEAVRDGGVSALTANLVREACRHVNQGGADIARQAYLLAGTKGLREGPLQRGFRDLHAGSQHFFASPMAAVDLTRSLLAEA